MIPSLSIVARHEARTRASVIGDVARIAAGKTIRARQMARQQSILGFVCLGPQHGGPGLEVVDVEERRRREAARLGLPWPPAKRVCRVGRPKFSDKYLDRIHALLETGDWATLARLETAQAPAAWRPGDPIGAEEQDMENA